MGEAVGRKPVREGLSVCGKHARPCWNPPQTQVPYGLGVTRAALVADQILRPVRPNAR